MGSDARVGSLLAVELVPLELVDPELLVSVALPALLSPALPAIEPLREELFAESAIASCCVPEPLKTTSSIEPIFWPSRP